MNEIDWSKQLNRNVNIIKRKKDGDTEHQFLETFDRSAKDQTPQHYYGVVTPDKFGDPDYLGSNKTEAERLFDKRTK